MTGPFRIVAGLILLAIGVVVYIYASGYASSVQSCLNGFACSLGSYIEGDTSQLQSELYGAQAAEAIGAIMAVIGVAVLAYGLYNTSHAGKTG